MFKLSEFIKKGLLSAIGKMADYQIILNAASWHEKGVLTESDLAEISTAIGADSENSDEPPLDIEEAAE